MKWPLAPVVMCLVAGIVTGDALGIHWVWLLVFAGGLVVSRCWASRSRHVFYGTLLFLAGWLNLVWHQHVMRTDDLRVLLNGDAQIVTVEGVIAEAPRERLVETARGVQPRFSTRLAVKRLYTEGIWLPASGDLHVDAPFAPPPGLHRGRRVQATGAISPPPAATTPGTLDMQDYLARQGIHFQLHTSRPADWILTETNSPLPWPERFQRWAMDRIQGPLPAGDESVMLLHAMGLGWKTGVMGEVKEPFIRSGTMHLFAISGLHVALIALMLVELLRALGVPRRICGAVLIPLLWFYTAATGWQASAVRSAIMMSVIGAGWALERPSNLLNSLAAAALLILVLDPQQLFLPGFQLSFMVVLSMGLLLPPIEEWRKQLFSPDPLLPEQLRPRWQRWLDWPVRFVTVNAVTSLAAWVGSLPLIAYYFHLVTPVSLIANLLLVPLSSLALMASFGSLVMAWCPPVADLFSYAAWALMEGMVNASAWFADWPAAWWPLPSPGPLVIMSYYALVLPLFATPWKSPWRWRLAGAAGAALAVTVTVGWHNRADMVRLTILDVRGGDAHVFENRSQPLLLIDAGNQAAYESLLKPYLMSCGVRRVPDLLISHGDVRHVGGAPALIEDFAPRRLLTSPAKSRSPGYKEILERWNAQPKTHLILTNGSRHGPWKILHPAAADQFSSGDDNALVLYGELEGVTILLLSDLGRLGQQALLERHPGLRADLVVTGIPAKEQALGDPLLAALRPQVVIVTCARSPAGEQASPAFRERLDRSGATVLYLDETGTVMLDFLGQGCQIHTVSGPQFMVTTRRHERGLPPAP